jgi:hypothetical protein
MSSSMNDKPALFIEFDPQTWELTKILFKASTDVETKKLTEILTQGVKYKIDRGENCDA